MVSPLLGRHSEVKADFTEAYHPGMVQVLQEHLPMLPGVCGSLLRVDTDSNLPFGALTLSSNLPFNKVGVQKKKTRGHNNLFKWGNINPRYFLRL